MNTQELKAADDFEVWDIQMALLTDASWLSVPEIRCSVPDDYPPPSNSLTQAELTIEI